MKKILMLTTGGTISCVKTENGLIPSLTGDEILSKVDLPNIDLNIVDLFSVDSTNISRENWIDLANKLFDEYENFDAFIVTHGTDTLAYTACMLHYMLTNFNKPLILTGSQFPIIYKDTDAFDNLKLAFSACLNGYCGVYIAFGGRIIKGVKAVKTDSVNFDAFSEINNIQTDNNNQLMGKLAVNTNIDTNIVALKITPNMSPKIIKSAVELGYRAIILECFGIGGIPTFMADFVENVKFAINSGVAVILKSQCLNGRTDLSVYEMGHVAKEIGCICADNMTFEECCAYAMVKLIV